MTREVPLKITTLHLLLIEVEEEEDVVVVVTLAHNSIHGVVVLVLLVTIITPQVVVKILLNSILLPLQYMVMVQFLKMDSNNNSPICPICHPITKIHPTATHVKYVAVWDTQLSNVGIDMIMLMRQMKISLKPLLALHCLILTMILAGTQIQVLHHI